MGLSFTDELTRFRFGGDSFGGFAPGILPETVITIADTNKDDFNAGTPASLSVSFAAGISAGDIIAFAGMWDSASPNSGVTVTTDLGDSGVFVDGPTSEAALSAFCFQGWFSAPTAGAITVTITYNSGTHPVYGALYIWRISGFVAAKVDKHVVATGSDTTPTVNTGTLSTTKQAAVAFANPFDQISSVGGSGGWTSDGISTVDKCGGEHQTVSSNSALDAVFTQNTSNPWYCAIMTFMEAGYSTSFPLTENPISENAIWANGLATGLDWSNMRTTPSLAFGTQTGSDGFNDSIAILGGTWGADQYARCVAKCASASGSFDEEVELLLRFSISGHDAHGYEVNFSCAGAQNAYISIVRWNGTLGDFFQMAQLLGTGVNDGDILEATIIGTTITVYKNGSQVLTDTDSAWSSGAPGMGCYNNGAGSGRNSEFGLKSFLAKSL